MRKWLVTFEGSANVEAETAEDAIEMVEENLLDAFDNVLTSVGPATEEEK